MTLQDWQSKPALAEELAKTLALPIMVMAREVIGSMSPTRQVAALTPEVIRDTSQFQLGKIAGYHERDVAEEMLLFVPKEVRQAEANYQEGKKPDTIRAPGTHPKQPLSRPKRGK